MHYVTLSDLGAAAADAARDADYYGEQHPANFAPAAFRSLLESMHHESRRRSRESKLGASGAMRRDAARRRRDLA